jgi:hypothetical protein
LNPSKTSEDKKKFWIVGKSSTSSLKFLCFAKSIFSLKNGRKLVFKFFLHGWQVLAHNKIQKIITAL